jgi:hypothetical protein
MGQRIVFWRRVTKGCGFREEWSVLDELNVGHLALASCWMFFKPTDGRNRDVVCVTSWPKAEGDRLIDCTRFHPEKEATTLDRDNAQVNL